MPLKLLFEPPKPPETKKHLVQLEDIQRHKNAKTRFKSMFEDIHKNRLDRILLGCLLDVI